MKFIKTADGYVNAAHVRNLYVGKELIGDRAEYFIKAETTDGDMYYFAENFKTKEEAEEYLDELIEELEESE